MKNIVIIPARGGSKRLPRKNSKLLNSIPLIAYSIRYALANAVCIDAIYVSTDDPEIKEISSEYGVNVVDRPQSISGDYEPTVSALKHVLENISNEVENVILLQPTNPLRPVSLLNDALSLYENQNYDSLFTVSKNSHKLGKVSSNLFTPFNYTIGQRSQDLEPLYFENGLLYISKAKLILENKILSEKAYPMIIDHPFAKVDIDTQDDFDYAEYLLKK